MMIKAMIELAGYFALGSGRKVMEKKAFKALVSAGVLPSSAEFGAKGTQTLLKAMGSKGFNAGRTSRFFYGGARVSKPLGIPGLAGVTQGGRLSRQIARHGYAGAQIQNQATRAFQVAAGHLDSARAFGGAQKALMGIPLVGMGFSLFSGMDRFAEKNVAPPAQEIAQTQQMFMPRQAYTQRQRAIQAIHQSGMTTRSALGNESMYMHG